MERERVITGTNSVKQLLCVNNMNETELANIIANKVISDTQFWIALIGIAGVIIGSVITLIGNYLMYKLKEKKVNDLETKRKALLTEMLNDNRFKEKWRTLNTLSSVIGASEEETKRLLVSLDARGSEKADGKWSLITNNPLPGPK